MRRLWDLYTGLLKENQVWIKYTSYLALAWFFVGMAVYVTMPELLPKFLAYLDDVFKEILGTDEPVATFGAALSIFRQNFTVALISLFLGAALALAPLLIVAVNFTILGFLSGAAIFYTSQPTAGFLAFFITIVPHGMVEIPALILSASLGIRFGLSVINGEFKKVGLQILQLLPLIAAMFFLAAILEIFVTLPLVQWLLR